MASPPEGLGWGEEYALLSSSGHPAEGTQDSVTITCEVPVSGFVFGTASSVTLMCTHMPACPSFILHLFPSLDSSHTDNSFPSFPRAFVYTIPVAWRVLPLFTFRKGMTNGLSGKLVASWSLE